MLYPKFIFPGALKEAFLAVEDRSYQTQYVSEIFRGASASTLHIHVYLHLKESSGNVL